MATDRPPPEGRLLFRFKPPEMTRHQIGMTDVCAEYAVTALTEEQIDSSECIVAHNGVIVWGWLSWKKDWEANVSARPVVFELLKRWRDTSAWVHGQDVSLPDLASESLRLPGEP